MTDPNDPRPSFGASRRERWDRENWDRENKALRDAIHRLTTGIEAIVKICRPCVSTREDGCTGCHIVEELEQLLEKRPDEGVGGDGVISLEARNAEPKVRIGRDELKALALAADRGEGPLRLVLQLFGIPPCDACGYIKSGCRCAKEGAP